MWSSWLQQELPLKSDKGLVTWLHHRRQSLVTSRAQPAVLVSVNSNTSGYWNEAVAGEDVWGGASLIK